MKKSLLVVSMLLVLIVGAWGGATYWFSIETERHYLGMLKQASESPYVKITNERYTRGFLGSEALTAIEIRMPPDAPAQIQAKKITLVHDIKHGPFPLSESPDGKRSFRPLMATVRTRIMFPPEIQSALDELVGQIPEIGSIWDYTIIYLDGGGEERFFIPAFRHTLGDTDKADVDWGGLSLQTRFNPGFKAVTGSFAIPGFNISAKEFDLKTYEVKYSFDVQEGVAGLPLGDASFDLASIQVADRRKAASQAVDLHGLEISSSARASGDTITVAMGFHAAQLKLGDTAYGPGVLEVEVRNLDANSLAKLQQVAREFQPQPSQQSAEELQAMLLNKYIEIIPELLERSPEIEVTRLNIATPDGDLTGKIKVAFDGTKASSFQDASMAAKAVKAQVELRAAEKLVHRAASVIAKTRTRPGAGEQEEPSSTDREMDGAAMSAAVRQVEGLVAQNILVKEDSNYSLKASYDAGQVVLNGRPLPLNGFMQ